jgi:hypothetical protein
MTKKRDSELQNEMIQNYKKNGFRITKRRGSELQKEEVQNDKMKGFRMINELVFSKTM